MSVVSVGDRYGSVTVVYLFSGERKSGSKKRMASCICDCGGMVDVEIYNLRTGNTKQCSSCAHKTRSENSKTHGKSYQPGTSGTVEAKSYYTWQAMKRRCLNANSSGYSNYGGRGISVCSEWTSSYESFLEDMGLPPSMDSQIDRVDNNGNYEKKNCRWVSRSENARNKRNTVMITAFGETRPLQEWAEIKGIPYGKLKARLKRGTEPEAAMYSTERSRRYVYFVDGSEYKTLEACAMAAGICISAAASRFSSASFPEWVKQ